MSIASNPLNPKRGEIWLVNFDPTIGSEIKKTRPAVVVSSDSVGKLPLKVVVPITGWEESFENDLWQVPLDPNTNNKLNKLSSVDTLQIKSLDLSRFVYKIGYLSVEEMESVALAICGVIEYP